MCYLKWVGMHVTEKRGVEAPLLLLFLSVVPMSTARRLDALLDRRGGLAVVDGRGQRRRTARHLRQTAFQLRPRAVGPAGAADRGAAVGAAVVLVVWVRVGEWVLDDWVGEVVHHAGVVVAEYVVVLEHLVQVHLVVAAAVVGEGERW